MLFASLLDAVACSCFEAASYDVGVEKCHKLSFFILGTVLTAQKAQCNRSTKWLQWDSNPQPLSS